MTTSEIITLLNAGYTKAEIEALEKGGAPEAKTEEKKDVSLEETKDKPDAASPAPDSAGSEAMNELAKTVASLSATVKALQESNLKAARQEQVKPRTAEDAIKNFMSRM